MRTSMRDFLRASVEDAELVERTIYEDPTADGAADAHADLLEEAKAVDAATDAVDNLDEKACAMESLVLTLEEILDAAPESEEDAGLDTPAIALVEQQVESTADALGVDDPEAVVEEVVPAAESFRTNRRAATVSLENGVVDFLKKIWNAIKNAIIAAWEAIVSFFQRLFGGVKSLIKRADALKKRANDLKEEGGGKDIKYKGVRYLLMGKEAFSASVLEKGLNNSLEVGNAIFTSYATYVKNVYKGSAENLKAALKDLGDTGKFSNRTFKASRDEEINESYISKKIADGHLLSGIIDIDLPGEVHFEVPNSNEYNKGIEVMVPQLVHQTTHGTIDPKTEIKTLTKSECIAALSKVKSILELMDKKGKTVDEMNKAAAEYRGANDDMIKRLDANAAVVAWERVKFQKLMRMGGKPWGAPVVKYSAHMFGVCRHAMGLVDASITESAKK